MMGLGLSAEIDLNLVIWMKLILHFPTNQARELERQIIIPSIAYSTNTPISYSDTPEIY